MTELEISITYDDQEVGSHRLDILVEDIVVLELNTVESLNRVHYEQLRSYLKASHKNLGFLINFARDKADYRRVEFRTSP